MMSQDDSERESNPVSMTARSVRQLTIRIADSDLERRILEVASREGISLNGAVLRLLRRAAGLEEPPHDPACIGDALDEFIGTWSDDQADEVMQAVRDFDRIDESLWR